MVWAEHNQIQCLKFDRGDTVLLLALPSPG